MSEDNLYCRILKGFQFTNEDKSFFAYVLTRASAAVLWLERISRTSTVHVARQGRTAVGPRARAGYLRWEEWQK